MGDLAVLANSMGRSRRGRLRKRKIKHAKA